MESYIFSNSWAIPINVANIDISMIKIKINIKLAYNSDLSLHLFFAYKSKHNLKSNYDSTVKLLSHICEWFFPESFAINMLLFARIKVK